MRDNTSPISVILVSSGSRGNKLLFRYPFQRSQEHPASQTSFQMLFWQQFWQPSLKCVAKNLN
ncbi:NPRL3 isoform 10 [Pan troglodytes]|uniref:NPR3 like, GATOR1 complex subunit n=3 Tax=Hominidae TaxID=9604 RepID=F8WCB2_HUMAN|nr:NPR3 like, GATOR1 complex subunit [Homo sapiens]KAI4052487.1 NPR3 like, GATOR1 complex subunit [Homo sapiens]PNI12025.1 NPRL3 isoform 10 [Pan troglodytes]PNJ02740.1 NPRL3 isoform 10 [Pongo abelii]